MQAPDAIFSKHKKRYMSAQAGVPPIKSKEP
jgi:hypothetical protein